MSDSSSGTSQSTLTGLKTKLNEIITGLTGPQSNGDRPVTPPVLQQTATRLDDLLPMLQFEQMRAENNGDWDLADAASEAVLQCEQALDSVNAAILRASVIGLHRNDILEMQSIRKQVQSAMKLQQVMGSMIQIAGLVRRLVM